MRASECRNREDCETVHAHCVEVKEGSLLWSVITETAGRLRQKGEGEEDGRGGKGNEGSWTHDSLHRKNVGTCPSWQRLSHSLSLLVVSLHADGPCQWPWSLSSLTVNVVVFPSFPRNLFHINSCNCLAVPPDPLLFQPNEQTAPSALTHTCRAASNATRSPPGQAAAALTLVSTSCPSGS